MKAWIDGPDGPHEFPRVRGLHRDIDGQKQVESKTYSQRERDARERLFYNARPTYLQPHLIEGRSSLTVAEVLGKGKQ